MRVIIISKEEYMDYRAIKERQQRHGVGRRWCCSAHTGNEVNSCVGKGFVYILACVIFIGLFMASQHFIN